LNDNQEATYLWVAETVLRKHGRPLRARELVNYGLEDQLFSDKELSRTPQKSMQARLSMDILRDPNQSRFVRTARGRFFLRELIQRRERDEKNSALSGQIEEYTAIRRQLPPASENVLVIHRQNYSPILNFQGLGIGLVSDLSELLRPSITKYLPRTHAETNSDYKQFVTYTIIQHHSSVLSFTRGTYNRAASFLRGARCIGFGGHVTDADISLFSREDLGVRANAAREIREEILLSEGRPVIDPTALEVLGILNDDSSDVGVRHVAIVLRYWVDDIDKWQKPLRGESSINQLRWLNTNASPVNLSEFEYWSQLCIRSFFPSYLNTIPRFRVLRRSIFKQDHILCVVGAIGSGKSVATKALVDQGAYVQVNSGQVLAELLDLPPVPETDRASFQSAAEAFISKAQGPRRLAVALVAAANKLGVRRIVLDGIRHPETLAALRENSELPVAVLYVYTPPDVAFDMYQSREHHRDKSMSFKEFISLYNAPVEGKTKYILNEADVILYNWMGLDQYEIAIKDMMEEIGVSFARWGI
jgi:predicted NUDIX family phosphoesterase/dephospho-CoA kinase